MNLMKGSNKENDLIFTVMVSLVFIVTIYLYYPFVQNYSTTPKWVVLSLLSIFFYSIGNKKIKISWGLIIWILFVFQFILQSFRSYNFWEAITHSIPLILAPVIVQILIANSKGVMSFYKKLALIIALTIIPLLLYSLVEISLLYSSNAYNHGTTYLFRYSFGHRNQFLQFLTLLVPLIIVGFDKTLWKKILFISTIGLIYLVTILLMNRTVLLVLFGIYPLGLLIYVFFKSRRKIRFYIVSSGLTIVLIGIAILSQVQIKSTSVLGRIFNSDYGSGYERVRIWENSIELWKESPIVGKGSGDWKIEILDSPLLHTKAEQSMVFYQRAHNDFIQILVENGLIGLIALLLFFVLASIQLLRSDLKLQIKLPLVIGVIAFVLVANFSFPMEKIELLMVLFLFLLPGLSKKYSDANEPVKKSGSIRLGTLVTLIGILFLSFTWLGNEQKYFNYRSSNNVNDLSEINMDFYSIDPMSTPLYWHKANDLYQEKEYEKAIKYYSKSVQYNPNNVHALNNLGSSYYALGDMKSAEENYKKALEVNPFFTGTLMNYASLEFNSGDINGALVQILKVVRQWEPENYRIYIIAIAKAKCQRLVELHDDPEFESFLRYASSNEDLLYEISLNCRNSGACYEVELRKVFSEN